MNANTKEKLKDFISSVETLTAAVTLQIGVATASEILTACFKAKQALDKDETITDLS